MDEQAGITHKSFRLSHVSPDRTKSNTFFWLSILSAIAAFVLQTAAYGMMDEGSKLKAKSIEAAMMNHAKVQPNPEATTYFAKARILRYIGLSFTGFGFICLLAALYRNEHGWYLILVGLLCFGLCAATLL
jgi:hypothetical protein